MILVCHVILQDQVILRSSKFISGSSSRYVTSLPILFIIGAAVVNIYGFGVHVILQGYITKGLSNFTGGGKSR